MAVPPGDEEHEDEEDDFGLTELIPQYFALCRRDLQNLRAALDEKQFDQIRVLGHNLKGSGGAYGFPGLSEIGARIETAAKAGNESEAREGVEQLAEFLKSRDVN